MNRATLGRQLLLERAPLGVADGLRQVVALQAQHPASPYLALWNRLDGFDAGELDDGFATGGVVKATLLRITLHAVHAEDYPAWRAAVQQTLRGARLHDRRFAASGLSPQDADALLPELLGAARDARTTTELQAWLARRLDEQRAAAAWWGLRYYAPLVHAPTGAAWSFGPRPSFRAAPRPPDLDEDGCAAGLRTLLRRYLAGFGPASISDMARFALLYRPPLRQAVTELAAELEELRGPDGTVLYDLPGAPRPPEDTPAPPRLLGMWDSVLLAHADRSRVLPEKYRKLVIATNGDVLPTVLVDGFVAGVWRPVDGGIEVTAFHRLAAPDWAGLGAEAEALLALLAEREPRVYRRYDRWWVGLPAAQVRVLPGT